MRWLELVLELLGVAVAVGAMFRTHAVLQRRAEEFFERRLEAMDEAEEGRRVAAFKQAKKVQQRSAESDRIVRKLADETRSLQDETKRAVRRVDRFVGEQKTGGGE